jgi:hypothetical protein
MCLFPGSTPSNPIQPWVGSLAEQVAQKDLAQGQAASGSTQAQTGPESSPNSAARPVPESSANPATQQAPQAPQAARTAPQSPVEARSTGAGGTILTNPQGLEEQATTMNKTLLGG